MCKHRITQIPLVLQWFIYSEGADIKFGIEQTSDMKASIEKLHRNMQYKDFSFVVKFAIIEHILLTCNWKQMTLKCLVYNFLELMSCEINSCTYVLKPRTEWERLLYDMKACHVGHVHGNGRLCQLHVHYIGNLFSYSMCICGTINISIGSMINLDEAKTACGLALKTDGT